MNLNDGEEQLELLKVEPYKRKEYGSFPPRLCWADPLLQAEYDRFRIEPNCNNCTRSYLDENVGYCCSLHKVYLCVEIMSLWFWVCECHEHRKAYSDFLAQKKASGREP